MWDKRADFLILEQKNTKRILGESVIIIVLSDHRKEYADHDFDWNNVVILHSESNKGKREFMEILYIKREGTYSINLKTDLVKYNGRYDSMISYL